MISRKYKDILKTTEIIEKMMLSFVKREDSPIKLLSFTLRCSNSTILGLIHGRSHNVEHYITLFSYYSRIHGWKQDFSRVPKMLEKALREKGILVIGVKNKRSGKVEEWSDLFWKE